MALKNGHCYKVECVSLCSWGVKNDTLKKLLRKKLPTEQLHLQFCSLFADGNSSPNPIVLSTRRGVLSRSQVIYTWMPQGTWIKMDGVYDTHSCILDTDTHAQHTHTHHTVRTLRMFVRAYTYTWPSGSVCLKLCETVNQKIDQNRPWRIKLQRIQHAKLSFARWFHRATHLKG